MDTLPVASSIDLLLAEIKQEIKEEVRCRERTDLGTDSGSGPI